MRLVGAFARLGAAIAICATASGCTAVDQIAAITSVDGSVTFLFCEPVEATELEVREARESTTDAIRILWRAEGDAEIDDTRVDYGVPPDGMTSVSGPESPLADEFVIYARSSADSGAVRVSVQGTFSLSELESDRWTMADGTKRDEPPC